MHRETLYIYQTARPETKACYALGHYVEGGTEENWIIKWFLWHVFRYRDNRNRGRSVPAWNPQESMSSQPSGDSEANIGDSDEQRTPSEYHRLFTPAHTNMWRSPIQPVQRSARQRIFLLRSRTRYTSAYVSHMVDFDLRGLDDQ